MIPNNYGLDFVMLMHISCENVADTLIHAGPEAGTNDELPIIWGQQNMGGTFYPTDDFALDIGIRHENGMVLCEELYANSSPCADCFLYRQRPIIPCQCSTDLLIITLLLMKAIKTGNDCGYPVLMYYQRWLHRHRYSAGRDQLFSRTYDGYAVR